MIDIERLKSEIVERLKPLEPEKIILFGSYAYGTPNEESDVDIYVVTRDDFIPKDYDENNSVYLRVSRVLRDIRETTSVDIVVHTKKMYEKFAEMNSSFSRQLLGKGISLYES